MHTHEKTGLIWNRKLRPLNYHCLQTFLLYSVPELKRDKQSKIQKQHTVKQQQENRAIGYASPRRFCRARKRRSKLVTREAVILCSYDRQTCEQTDGWICLVGTHRISFTDDMFGELRASASMSKSWTSYIIGTESFPLLDHSGVICGIISFAGIVLFRRMPSAWLVRCCCCCYPWLYVPQPFRGKVNRGDAAIQ